MLRHDFLRRARAPIAGLALACAAGAARAADPAVDPAWLPLRAGAQWVYEVHRDQSYRPDNATIKRAFHVGRATGVAEPAPKRTPGGFLVRERLVLEPVSGTVDKETTEQWTLYSFAGELRMHASGETRPDGGENESVYDPPLRLLPTTAVGRSWDAGLFRNGDQRVELRGEVVGVEDVEGEPRWPGCLKVRYQGSVAGSAPVENGVAEISSAHYDRTLWFARGVGIVRDVTVIESDLKLPDGHTAHGSLELKQRLLEHRLPK